MAPETKADRKPPPWFAVDGQAVYVRVRVQPRASRNRIDDSAPGERLKVWVTAPPVDRAANQALLALLAEHWDLKRRSLSLSAGERSREKTVRIEWASAARRWLHWIDSSGSDS